MAIGPFQHDVCHPRLRFKNDLPLGITARNRCQEVPHQSRRQVFRKQARKNLGPKSGAIHVENYYQWYFAA
jgi:hypothetical protein